MNTKSFFRSLLLAIALPIFGGIAIAQQSFGGTPLSFAASGLRKTTSFKVEPHIVPLDFNVDDIRQRSLWENARQGKAPVVGKLISCSFDFVRDAQKIFTTDEVEVYRMAISTEGTPAGVNLYYSDFFIPKGGKLYIYDEARRHLLGSYTHDTHGRHGAFATEPLPGNSLILEYERPLHTDMPSLHIEAIGYLIKPVLFGNEATGGLDQSDPYLTTVCQININCPEGDEWQDEKAGVVTYIQLIQEGNEWFQSACSGNLMNNSAQDFKPYIITAAHCAGEERGTSNTNGKWAGGFLLPQDKLDQWIFGFHYERPRCSNGELAHYNVKTMTGCYVRSYLSLYGYSDGMLLELKEQVPQEYRVFYNGFDASEKVPTKGVGIHHPAQDSKKIALYDGGVKVTRWNTTDSRGGVSDHFRFSYQSGQTEGGSSGSSLFDENKLVVATLTGGSDINCKGNNFYGRLFSHWDKYKDKGDLYNMSKFLDPQNKGRKLSGTWRNGYTSLKTIKSIKTSIDSKGENVTLEWTAVPPHSQGYTITYDVYRNRNKIAEVESSKNSFIDPIDMNMRTIGTNLYAVVPRYTLQDGTSETAAPIYTTAYLGKVRYEVPENSIKRTVTDQGVKLAWDQITNAQVITKYDPSKANYQTTGKLRTLSANYTRVWLLNTWRTESFGSDEDLYISQINFVPAQAGKTYQLVVHQRGSQPSVVVTKSPAGTEATNQMHHVVLAQPFKVSNKQSLFVGYQHRPTTPHSIRIVEGSADDEYTYNGGKIFLLGNTYTGEGIFDVTKELEENLGLKGYLALELVFTNNPNPLVAPITDPWIRSYYPTAFPKIKHYEVYKNGSLLGHTASANEQDRNYTDPIGKEGDSYIIKAVYEDYPNELNIEQLKAAQEPCVYPAIFDNYLNIGHTEQVQALHIYNLQGALLLSVDNTTPNSTISTEELPEGEYIAVLSVAGKQITQKVIKR